MTSGQTSSISRPKALAVGTLTFLLATVFASVLLLSLKALLLLPDVGAARSVWSDALFTNAVVPIVSFAARIIEKFIPWPMILIVALVLLARSPTPLTALFSILKSFRKVSIFGADIELTDESRQKLRGNAVDVGAAIKEYRYQVTAAVRGQVERLKINEALYAFATDKLRPILGGKFPAQFRCTFHVEDFVLSDHLMQLTDYCPLPGGAPGRALSVRYGIVGKVWRSGLPKLVGNLLDTPLKGLTEPELISHITEDWGMKQTEAPKVLAKPSYACVPVQNKLGETIAVFYMDSSENDAFAKLGVSDSASETERKRVISAINGALAASSLPAKIGELIDRLKDDYLHISISEFN